MTTMMTPWKTGLLAFSLHIGITASALAGGAAHLELPLEGVTSENREQCVKLFEEKLSSVLLGWSSATSREVNLITEGRTPPIRLRLGLHQLSRQARSCADLDQLGHLPEA